MSPVALDFLLFDLAVVAVPFLSFTAVCSGTFSSSRVLFCCSFLLSPVSYTQLLLGTDALVSPTLQGLSSSPARVPFYHLPSGSPPFRA